MSGTWNTGSSDPEAERAALRERDEALHALLGSPGDQSALQRVEASNREVARLGDASAFLRVLAALPVHRPEIVDRHPVHLTVMSTVPAALPELAEYLLQRREDTALRDLQEQWLRTAIERSAALDSDQANVRAEVLALAMPGHPYARHLERPSIVAPRRDEAMTAWQASQRPESTVHILFGDVDPDAAEAGLGKTFAATSLPPVARPTVAAPLPIQGQRRSIVRGTRRPMLAIAFVLAPADDRTVLDVAVRWLGGGPESVVGQALRRAGHERANVTCTAPWPHAVGDHGLLLLEITGPADGQGLGDLADTIVETGRKAVSTPPAKDVVDGILLTMQRDWIELADDPRWLVAAIAEAAAYRPDLAPRLRLPDRVEAPAVRQLLARCLAGQPVIVEGRP
jgi:predicted Zn-dependent peptidase